MIKVFSKIFLTKTKILYLDFINIQVKFEYYKKLEPEY